MWVAPLASSVPVNVLFPENVSLFPSVAAVPEDAGPVRVTPSGIVSTADVAGLVSVNLLNTGSPLVTPTKGLSVAPTATPVMVVELWNTPTWWIRGEPVVLILPPPAGVAHVPSPLQNVEEDAEVPLLRLPTGRLPVTPVESGSPVAFVSVTVGSVARTTFPLPVDATKLRVEGSEVPVFNTNPVVGATGSVIMKGVVTDVGAMNPTLLVGAVVAVPCPAAHAPPTLPPAPVVILPGVEILPLESIVAVAAAV